MIRLPLLLVLLLGLVFAGCESEVDHFHPKVMHDVALARDQPIRAFAIERGSGIRLRLPAAPAGSSLQWLIVGNNVRILEQTSDLLPTDVPPGGRSVTFFSLKPGKSIVRFALLDPSEQDTAPTARLEVTVTVKSDDD